MWVKTLTAFSFSGNEPAQFPYFDYMDNLSPEESIDTSRIPLLRPREREVLRYISEGKSNWEIGVILGRKTETVKKHVHRMLKTLGVENRVCAALVYLEWRSIAGGGKEAA